MAYGAITGRYSLALATGTVGAGITAESEIYQFRWASTTTNARVLSVRVSAGNLGTAFAAGFGSFSLYRATPWSIAGTGGTASTLTTINGKHTPDDPVTTLTESRIATTAALGAGTKTLAAHPLGAAWFGVAAAAGAKMLDNVELLRFPVVLGTAATSGLAITVTVPATGTWTGGVIIAWEEFA